MDGGGPAILYFAEEQKGVLHAVIADLRIQYDLASPQFALLIKNRSRAL
jgi:hypothetical protein